MPTSEIHIIRPINSLCVLIAFNMISGVYSLHSHRQCESRLIVAPLLR